MAELLCDQLATVRQIHRELCDTVIEAMKAGDSELFVVLSEILRRYEKIVLDPLERLAAAERPAANDR